MQGFVGSQISDGAGFGPLELWKVPIELRKVPLEYPFFESTPNYAGITKTRPMEKQTQRGARHAAAGDVGGGRGAGGGLGGGGAAVVSAICEAGRPEMRRAWFGFWGWFELGQGLVVGVGF